MSEHLPDAIKILAEGRHPRPDVLEGAFRTLLGGEASDAGIAAFLMGLRLVGETGETLAVGAKLLRETARRPHVDGPLLDTCGTGGLGWRSLNTSTATAILVAACGGRVAKHGNRSVPPKTGSADVLEALGVELDIDEATFHRCLDGVGVAFMFARVHHSAMRHVAGVRAELAIRTVFNLLGPLSNPAAADHQILGVFAPQWITPMAEALRDLGVKRAWVVHGSDGIDEVSISGTTLVCEVRDGALRTFEVVPGDAGLAKSALAALEGGSPAENAAAIRELFEGRPGPFRDAVVLNAAAGLVILGLAEDLTSGARMAAAAIDTGKAMQTLNGLVRLSQGGR
jgi:anthranilate phosphoribosyltransferase